MGNTLQNKVIYKFHEKIVFDFLKKIRNYLVANPIIRIDQRNREESEEEMIRQTFFQPPRQTLSPQRGQTCSNYTKDGHFVPGSSPRYYCRDDAVSAGI